MTLFDARGNPIAARVEQSDAQVTRAQGRRAQYTATFRDLSGKYAIPRNKRRAIVRDVLKKQRAEMRQKLSNQSAKT